jgi:hypothetical protein
VAAVSIKSKVAYRACRYCSPCRAFGTQETGISHGH